MWRGQRRSDLIYDIGAHTGDDTDFYLGKGFRVVAVEANPVLVRGLHERFGDQVRNGRLAVVDRAVGLGLPDTISFFVNHDKDDWSAVDREVASKGVHDVNEIRVPTTSLEHLFDQHGVPHYLKVDIEGSDLAVARALLAQPHRPDYVSFEWHEAQILAVLAAAGYESFQVANQYLNGLRQRLVPTREGADYWPGFTGTHSGPFGLDLPDDAWVDLEGAMGQWVAYRALLPTADLRFTWLDLHARRAMIGGSDEPE